jgi:hypothetical protein
MPPLDPELEALPEPRRPYRNLTLAVLAATAISALSVSASLTSSARFSLEAGPPKELGSLTHVQLDPGLRNTWVHATGDLDDGAVEYRRPLDADRYRLVRSADNARLWVELRVPGSLEPEHYVPPNSFVGRLVPLDDAGLRYSSLRNALAELGEKSDGAWLLVDGEAPATTRWTLGVIALFVGFAAFGVWGVVRLVRPARAET